LVTTGIETTPMMVSTRAASYPCDRITPEVKNTVSETVSGSGDNGPIHGRKGFREHIDRSRFPADSMDPAAASAVAAGLAASD